MLMVQLWLVDKARSALEILPRVTYLMNVWGIKQRLVRALLALGLFGIVRIDWIKLFIEKKINPLSYAGRYGSGQLVNKKAKIDFFETKSQETFPPKMDKDL